MIGCLCELRLSSLQHILLEIMIGLVGLHELAYFGIQKVHGLALPGCVGSGIHNAIKKF